MNKQKRIWFAIVLPRSLIGYSLDVYPEELLAYRNWCRRRGQRLLGEFATREAAMREVKTWLAVESLSELKRINSTLTAIATEFRIRSLVPLAE